MCVPNAWGMHVQELIAMCVFLTPIWHTGIPNLWFASNGFKLSLSNLDLCILHSLFHFSVIPEEKAEKKEVTPDHLLTAIEEAYPNSLTVDDMAK